MKKMFIVLAKLLGLVQLYLALLTATQLAVMLGMVVRTDQIPLRGVLLGGVGLAIYLAVSLGIAWILIARTDWLAAKVGIQDDTPVEGLERLPALLVGICLIGIFVTVESLPRLARILIDLQRAWHYGPHHLIWGQMTPVLLQLFLGLILALRPNTVVGWIARKPAPPAA